MVFPADADDVVTIVNYAREHGVRIAPQATAHNAGPLGEARRDDRRADLGPAGRLNRPDRPPRARRLRRQVGEGGPAAVGLRPCRTARIVARRRHRGLLARRRHGLAGPQDGLQTGSVTAIELVTSYGQFIRATAENHPDLFGALRGGGGNFGIVTAIEFAVYPVEELYAGALFFPFERAAEVLHSWCAPLPTFPEELMTWANILHFPPLPEVPEPFRGASYEVIVMGAYLGDEPEGRELLERLRDLGPEIDTFAMVPPIELGELAMDPPASRCRS